MSNFWEWLKGKKTYLVAVVGFVLAGLKGSGVEIPPWVLEALVWAGLASVRHGMTTGA